MCLKRIKLTVAALALSACGASATGEARFVPLDTLFDTGIRHSLLLEADRIGQQMAAARRESAQSQRLPELSVGLNAGVIGQPVVFRRGLSHPTRPDAPDWSQNYAIDLRQPLYEGGRIRHAIEKAEIEESIRALQTAGDKASLKMTLLSHYLDLFCLYKQRVVLVRNIVESEKRLTDIRRLKEEGVITNNDVLRSEMQLTDSRLALTQTENGIRLASQQLDILLGWDESTLILPDTTLVEREYPLEACDAYVNRAKDADLTLLRLRRQTELARNNLRSVKAENLPSLSLYASNTLARPISRTLDDLYNNNWNVGLSFSYPLSGLYRNRGKLTEARHNIELSRNAEEQHLQTLRMDISRAYTRHREALERVEALRLSVRQAEENYRIMQNRYLSQLAILTDLLDADNLRLNAELQLATARAEAVYHYYELLNATGQL